MASGFVRPHTCMQGLFWEDRVEENFIGHQLSEIYRDGVYAPFFNGKKDLIVIDVGANIGTTTYYFSQFAKIVHSIEPSKQHFEVLKYMVGFNKLSNVKLHNLAIWIKNKKLPLFHNSKNKTMFSLHQDINDGVERPETVQAIDLEEFFKTEKIEHCDFMKLDVEGTEFEILGSTGFRKVASKIDTIVLEWHEWAGRNSNQLNQSLENNGFKVQPIQSGAHLLAGIKT